MADPQPDLTWIAEKGARYPIDDPRWQPVTRELHPVSVRRTVVILDSIFGRLVEAGYLRGNPVGLLPLRRRRPPQHVCGYLPPVMRQHVNDHVSAVPQEAKRSAEL